jgi:outer membrane protein assembly factor BamE (lipoprotein component of BamABCDE complex)
MKIIKTLSIFFLLTLLAGCAALGIKPKYIQNWPTIKSGMTKIEVEKAIGKPDSIVSEFEYDENQSFIGKAIVNTLFDGWHEKWCYGKSSIVTNIFLIPFGPPGNIYIVYFDKNGKVVGLRCPTKEPKKANKSLKQTEESVAL